MSISITSTAVTVDNQSATFEDIYQAAVSSNKTQYVSKLGTAYLLKGNLTLTNNATVSDINKHITIEGKYIQISTGCTLKLGERRQDLSTLNGCTLNAPNIENAYGFGHTTTTSSGNLLLYNSIVNIFGFWSFFKGDNLVEIIDCFIDGFGRISGPNSIMKNIIFKKSHGKFGCLSTSGNILLMKDMYSYDSMSFYDSTEKVTVKCAVYHNPVFTPNLTIYYGEYSGYEKLGYIESLNGSFTFELRGTKVNNGYSLYREVGSYVDFYHSFRFKPKILTPAGSPIMDARVVIKDKNNNVVSDTLTDNNGDVDVWVKYYKDLNSTRVGEILTPHTIEVTSGDITMINKLYINKNFEDFPLYLTEQGTGGGVDCDALNTYLDDMKTELLNKLDTVIENSMTTVVV